MTSGTEQVLCFRAAIEKNRQIFSLQHPYAYFAFFGVCEALDRVGRRLQVGGDVNGKSHVSLIPFLLIIQRQAMSAFESLSSCRSYEAWVLLRPALEAALIMGKWVDNPDNALIWSERVTRKTEYIKTFSGKGLISTSLPRAVEFRAVMDRLNDEFVHANEPYFTRHTNAEGLLGGDIFLRLEFFDESDDVEPHALAFLHLTLLMADALDQMLAVTLPTTGAHRPLIVDLESTLGEGAARSRALGSSHAKTLDELGLWLAVV